MRAPVLLSCWATSSRFSSGVEFNSSLSALIWSTTAPRSSSAAKALGRARGAAAVEGVARAEKMVTGEISGVTIGEGRMLAQGQR